MFCAPEGIYGVSFRPVRRVGLYEFLGRRVPPLAAIGTRYTEADTETYDDDSGLDQLAQLARESTMFSKVDGETYDDDPGVDGLRSPRSEGTTYTLEDAETFDDDPGIGGLVFATGLMSTVLTHRDGETYDDDPGLGGLGVPRNEGTTRTGQDHETFDDAGLDNLSVPMTLMSTTVTRVRDETYDDDPNTVPNILL